MEPPLDASAAPKSATADNSGDPTSGLARKSNPKIVPPKRPFVLDPLL